MKGIFVASTLLVGCAFAADPPACEGQRGCENARVTLLRAEAAVDEAARKAALWTTAQSALLEARAAFARADYDAATRAAASAAELAQMGVAQTRYPPFPGPEL